MYSCGPPHMDVQEWDDQHEPTYSNYVRTQDVTLKTCRRRWMIGRNGERGSGISALAARHDDDDDDIMRVCMQIYACPVGWGCRIHWLHLCRGVRPPARRHRVSQIWHKAIWWWGFSPGALIDVECPFLPLLPGPLWPGLVAPHRVLSMGQKELFDIKTVCKQMTYAKLNCKK